MIPKSGNRFSEKDHCSNKKLERDDDSKKSHPALGEKTAGDSPAVNFDCAVLRLAVCSAARELQGIPLSRASLQAYTPSSCGRT